MLRNSWKPLLLVAAAAIALVAPADAVCQKCKYVLFNGTICVPVGQGVAGWTECNDSQTCGTFGSPCGSGGGGSCTPEEYTCPENPV